MFNSKEEYHQYIIDKQKAELNELYQEREQAKQDIEKALAELKELELSYEKDIQTARVEATNEFVEILKEKTRTRDRVIIYGEDIDNCLKETVAKYEYNKQTEHNE